MNLDYKFLTTSYAGVSIYKFADSTNDIQQ